jgi:hypothetical protein
MSTTTSSQRWTTAEMIGCITGIVGAVVAGLSWVESKESRKIAGDAQQLSQRTYDRFAGKILPVISVRGDGNALVLQNLADLKAGRIGIFVKNVGTEPVDLIRTNVVTSAAWLLRAGPNEPSLMVPQTDEVESFDQKLLTTLQPEDERWVDLKRQIVSRLLKLRVEQPRKFGVFVIFNVDCYGRLVGQETPSANPDPKGGRDRSGRATTQSIPIHWYPDAFPKTETEAYLNEYHPAPP